MSAYILKGLHGENDSADTIFLQVEVHHVLDPHVGAVI